jgi:5-oxoprolinase (ATP-hydrolysing)
LSPKPGCGGSEAGPGFTGTSAIHTQMTNTRITDPEVLEMRYPVYLEAFAVRRGSGRRGKCRGSDGAVRMIRVVESTTVTLVSSRRSIGPLGLEGVECGLPGRHWVERANGKREDIAGIAQVELAAGDAIVIETPGGGGYCSP